MSKIPIINISLIEFTRRLLVGRRISLKGMFLLPVYYLQIIPTLPLAFLQYLIFNRRIQKTAIIKDPVFILGHYRSGTSLLHKLLASDSRFGYLTYYDALFPNTNLLFGKKLPKRLQHVVNYFRIQNPFFHDSALQLLEADEEDDYLMNKASAYSAYWGMIFPKQWNDWLNIKYHLSSQKYWAGWKKEYYITLKYITFKNPGKQLVLKSPPNLGRVRILLDMFPQAKFIFIYRNPYNIYFSTLNMWNNAVLKYYSVQRVTEQELKVLIINHFLYLMEQYEADKHLIPEQNLIEISYEELLADPFNTIKKIYTELSLPDFDQTEQSLSAKIETQKTYKSFQYQFPKEELDYVKEQWGKYIRKWNYVEP